MVNSSGNNIVIAFDQSVDTGDNGEDSNNDNRCQAAGDSKQPKTLSSDSR